MGDREQEDETLTVQQAARFLNVNRSTVIRWADLGLLPAVTTGDGEWGFRRSDLEAIRIDMGEEPE
jgi:excisionase family DNA binding protein